MERREFIRSIGACGGLFAVGGLAGGCRTADCDDSPLAIAKRTFERRLSHERLTLSYGHVKIGLPKPFSILHISDTHLCAAYPDELPYDLAAAERRMQTFGGKQEEALRDSLDWAKRNVDYVLHTGDLIDYQTEANFDLVRKYFGDMAMGTMGNHEFSPTMWLTKEKVTFDDAWREKSRAALTEAYPFDISFSSKIVNGVNFVMLDDSFGTVSQSQVERFAAEAKKGLPMVLCMHVAFFTEDIWLMKERFWRNQDAKFRNGTPPAPSGDLKRQLSDRVTRDFIAYLKSEPLLKAILAGHEHMVLQDRFSPTAVEYLVGGNFAFHGQEVLFT